MDMDLISLWALWRSLRRREASNRIEDIWMLAIACQGSPEGVTDWADRWEESKYLDYTERPAGRSGGLGIAELKRDFPRGQ